MKKIIYLLGFTLTFLACEEPEPELPQEMKCTLNGEPWNGGAMNHTLLRIVNSSPTGKRLDLRGTAMGLTIILTCVIKPNSAGNVMPLGTYAMGNTPEKEGLITILSGLSVEAVSSGYGEDIGQITITDMDSPTQRCSGTFEFKAQDFGSEEITYEAIDGTFSNLKYTVSTE